MLPNRLSKGDKVGIIAPASPPDLAKLTRGLAFLKAYGLDIKLGSNMEQVHGYLAGTDRERLDDLHAMFHDPEVKGIICACGGYGTGRIAAELDYDLIARHPKVFWGYSDITFLHTAIRQRTGLVTFHGPMVSSDAGREDFHSLSNLLFGQLFTPTQLIYSEAVSPLHTLAAGEAVGEITGGNLSLLVSTLGTAFEIDTMDKLLLIEDVDEEPYRIDGMLNQLKLAGKLADAAGIIIGDFKNAIAKKERPSLSLDEVLADYFSSFQKPVIKGFAIGHCQPHFSVPLGVRAKLSSREKTLLIAPGVY